MWKGKKKRKEATITMEYVSRIFWVYMEFNQHFYSVVMGGFTANSNSYICNTTTTKKKKIMLFFSLFFFFFVHNNNKRMTKKVNWQIIYFDGIKKGIIVVGNSRMIVSCMRWPH